MGYRLTTANAPGSTSTASSAPYDDVGWSNWSPTALAGSGGLAATSTPSGSVYTTIAKAYGFGFSIPSVACRVMGVTAKYNVYTTVGDTRSSFYKLQDSAGNPIGNEKNVSVTIPTGSSNIVTLGSATDRWGLLHVYQLAPGVINNTNFGIQFAVQGQGVGTNTVAVDYMTLQVAYELGVQDTFDRANGTPGSNWVDNGIYAYGIPKIYNNRLVSNTNTAYQSQIILYTGDSFHNDQWSEGLVYETYNMQFVPILMVRGGTADGGSGYWVAGDSQQAANGVRLFKKLPGQAAVQLGSTYTGNSMDGQMRLEATGSSSTVLDVYKGTVLLFSYTDSSSPILSGRPGVGMYETYAISSDANRSGWTDWSGGPTVEAGGMITSGRTVNSLVLGRMI